MEQLAYALQVILIQELALLFALNVVINVLLVPPAPQTVSPVLVPLEGELLLLTAYVILVLMMMVLQLTV